MHRTVFLVVVLSATVLPSVAQAQSLSAENVQKLQPKEIIPKYYWTLLVDGLNRLQNQHREKLAEAKQLEKAFKRSRKGDDLKAFKDALTDLSKLKKKHDKLRWILQHPITVQLIDDPHGAHPTLPRLRTHQSIREFLQADWKSVCTKSHVVIAMPLQHSATGRATTRGASRLSTSKSTSKSAGTRTSVKSLGKSWLGASGTGPGKTKTTKPHGSAPGGKPTIGSLFKDDFFDGKKLDNSKLPGKAGALGF